MIINPSKDTKIYWGALSTTAYLYGSAVKSYKDKSVSFNNSLIPSSQIIKEWNSSLSYQGARRTPSLRLLKREHTYQLIVDMEVTPEKTVFIELVFQDRFGVTVGNKISKGNTFEFTYPKEAYTYSIRLLSAGVEQFHFKSIEIKDIEDKLEN